MYGGIQNSDVYLLHLLFDELRCHVRFTFDQEHAMILLGLNEIRDLRVLVGNLLQTVQQPLSLEDVCQDREVDLSAS